MLSNSMNWVDLNVVARSCSGQVPTATDSDAVPQSVVLTGQL